MIYFVIFMFIKNKITLVTVRRHILCIIMNHELQDILYSSFAWTYYPLTAQNGLLKSY